MQGRFDSSVAIGSIDLFSHDANGLPDIIHVVRVVHAQALIAVPPRRVETEEEEGSRDNQHPAFLEALIELPGRDGQVPEQ